MSEWQPTPELRWRLKVIYYDNGGGETEQVLQQKWIKEDNKSMKKTFEWRDVPVT